jgi:hypothetical protein
MTSLFLHFLYIFNSSSSMSKQKLYYPDEITPISYHDNIIRFEITHMNTLYFLSLHSLVVTLCDTLLYESVLPLLPYSSPIFSFYYFPQEMWKLSGGDVVAQCGICGSSVGRCGSSVWEMW